MRTTGLLFGVALVVFVMVGFSGPAVYAVPTPLYEYKFNETGQAAPNTGSSAGSDDMDTRHHYWTSPDVGLHGAAGSGVSGAPSDRALDTSGITTHGGYFADGGGTASPKGAVPNAATSDILAQSQYTWSGWFNAAEPIPTEAYSNYIRLWGESEYNKGWAVTLGRWDSGVNELLVYTGTVTTVYDISSVMDFTDNGEWFFWAVTYDGTSTSSNETLYFGDITGVLLTSTKTANAGALPTTVSDLAINDVGNSGAGTLKGLADNLRVWDSVLSAQDVADVLAGDVVPEPGALLLVGTGVLGLLGFLRRKQMK